MAQHSILYRFPVEILENVALEIALSDVHGTYTSLTPLLCSCKHINAVLSFGGSNSLYARIFKGRYDVRAAERRFGSQALDNEHLAQQLRHYVLALQRIRCGDISSPYIVEILWVAYVMLLDNDGKNKVQLDRVHLDDFIDRFVRERVYENCWQNNGWPAESAANSLALWIMWMMSTPEKLRAESRQRRQQIVNVILPYVVLSFRYPSAHAPPNHYYFPLAEEFECQYPHSMRTVHGPFPLYREPDRVTQRITYFGRAVTISMPLVTVAAKLLYFSRREIVPFNIPPHLPINREHAMQLGHFHVGPTQEDVIEANAHVSARLLPSTKWSWWEHLSEEELKREFSAVVANDLKTASAKWDNDWMQLTYCYNPWLEMPGKGITYTAGTFTGLWHGRMIIPNEQAFLNLISTRDYPMMFSENHLHISTVPIYMRIYEHHCISPQHPIEFGGAHDVGLDDGLTNAYFPSVQLTKNADHVMLNVEGESTWTKYETYYADRPNSHDEDTCLLCKSSLEAECEEDFASVGLGDDDGVEDLEVVCSGITDIIFSGETDLRHGQAWNHFSFLGRIRTWDGLIAILRVPHDRRLGKIIFYGYIIGGQNFVGNWRPAGADVSAPCWESAFTMSRRDD